VNLIDQFFVLAGDRRSCNHYRCPLMPQRSTWIVLPEPSLPLLHPRQATTRSRGSHRARRPTPSCFPRAHAIVGPDYSVVSHHRPPSGLCHQSRTTTPCSPPHYPHVSQKSIEIRNQEHSSGNPVLLCAVVHRRKLSALHRPAGLAWSSSLLVVTWATT
jgi:hypothetical protein